MLEKTDKRIDSELDQISEKNLEDLRNIVSFTYKNLEKISRIIDNIDKEKRKEMYKSMPGVSGYFDGVYLVGEDGSKHEVPANYAAKSRIVYGDTLKMIEEDGKKMFKQIDKVPRKRLEGVLSKKEGKWYFLSDGGTYRISDVAAEFHKADLNDKAVAYVPENLANAGFAALDYLEKEKVTEIASDKKEVEDSGVAPKKPVKKIEKPKGEIELGKSPGPLPIGGEKNLTPKKQLPRVKKKEPKEYKKEALEAPKEQKEFVANIMEDDDLR